MEEEEEASWDEGLWLGVEEDGEGAVCAVVAPPQLRLRLDEEVEEEVDEEVEDDILVLRAETGTGASLSRIQRTVEGQ